ncbi:DUF3597 domain-containing protein [Falsiroseomonas selenitidurans]|uniref:DUF3597 domain-containing protein n=1 Tax=Falsiroseomonas selenitidurans TaxID=2716335 RepID=A0ABX1DY71_9PROT|nr:DUF3597 domain-containing protein [Falsiroseomonas selenitidurans]NKC29761.1 DUF3597 domain-containing protein [Falsiroseomonas selenitidurans]
MSIFLSIRTKILGEPDAMAATPGTKPVAVPPVDVEVVLMKLASASKQKLDWRRSIVDLLKLLGLDSTQDSRRELAKELRYHGDMADLPTLNLWLHRQVMTKLAEQGGRVPNSLRA